jgi:hypothetical protein
VSLNTLTSHESTTEKEEEEESDVGNRKDIEMEVCTRWNFLSNSQQNDLYTNVSVGGFEVSELRTMNGCEVRVSL